MNTPYFSIAIPAFKRAFLKECIQSVLNQTFTDFELIIINDNSPENLEEIIRSFKDPRIIYQKNTVGFGALNISKNWDECLKLARGNFFMCIGDDDKLLPDCLEKYISLINDFPGYNVYHAGTQLIDENSEVIDLQESRPIMESSYSMIWHSWFRARKTYIGDFLFDTESIKKFGGFLWFPYAWGSDEQTIYAIASDSGVVNMQNFGFQYRVNSQSISGSKDYYMGKAEAWRLGKEWFKQFLLKEPSDPSDLLYWRLTRKWMDWYFNDRYQSMMKKDFRDNHLKNYRFWLKNRKRFGLTRRSILFNLALGFKQSIF